MWGTNHLQLTERLPLPLRELSGVGYPNLSLEGGVLLLRLVVQLLKRSYGLLLALVLIVRIDKETISMLNGQLEPPSGSTYKRTRLYLAYVCNLSEHACTFEPERSVKHVSFAITLLT